MSHQPKRVESRQKRKGGVELLAQNFTLSTKETVEIVEKPPMCGACLSSNRKLRKIRPKHYEIFSKLTGIQFGFHLSLGVPERSFSTCFECFRKLCNLENFLTQVATAQNILNSSQHFEKVRCLTNLNISIKTDYDYSFIENDNSQQCLTNLNISKKTDYNLIEYENNKNTETQNKSDGNDHLFDEKSIKIKIECGGSLKNENFENGFTNSFIDHDGNHRKSSDEGDSDAQSDKSWIDGLSVKKKRKLKKPEGNNCKKGKSNIYKKERKKKATGERLCDFPEYICDQCGYKRRTKAGIETHIKLVHSPSQVCSSCNKIFPNLNRLNAHISRMHKTTGTEEESYCVICDKQFRNRLALKTHDYSCHKDIEKKRYACELCSKTYGSIFYLQNHIDAYHNDKRIYMCSQCPKTYKYNFGLKYHIKKFHSQEKMEKNKICYLCGRGFQTNRILQNHMNTHTDERPYQCDQCSFACNQKYPLTKHILKVHGGKKAG